MIDDIDSHERPGQGRGLGDVAMVDLGRIIQAADQRVPRQHQRAHAMALLVEPTGHARTDFASSACDENGHRQSGTRHTPKLAPPHVEPQSRNSRRRS